MAYEEEEAVKDAAIRKLIKEAGTEVERMEGRGTLKVGFGVGKTVFDMTQPML